MGNKLGVAILGCGTMGRVHAHAYLQTEKCQVLWLYDPDEEKAKALAESLPEPKPKVAPRIAEVLFSPEVRIVSIASPDHQHYGQAHWAMYCGKHVFVEKPMARSLPELRSLKYTWATLSDRCLDTNVVLREHPAFVWLEELITTGRLGEVFAWEGDYLYGRLEKIIHGWRKDVENYSVMLGGGIHLIDLMLWSTGQRPKWVSAFGNRICTKATDFRYNDFVAATYTFPSGMIGRITANFGCMMQHQWLVRVYGTKGTFIYDSLGAVFFDRGVSCGLGGKENVPREVDLGGRVIPDFVNDVTSVEEGGDRRGGTQLHFDAIAACCAADMSLLGQEKVPVEYV